MAQLTYRLLTEADKKRICSWHYEGDYALYNLSSCEEMKAKQQGFFRPDRAKNYYGFLEGELLLGYVNILEEEREVFIGIGVNPAHCGQHYGRRILEEAYTLSKSLYPGKPLYLEVRSWNQRAIRCYEHAGFCIDGEPYELTTPIGRGTFYRMVRE